MTQFLETIKLRMEEAQKRLQVAVQELQQAQLRHQAIAQEFAGWQTSYQNELRREQINGLVPPATAVPNANAKIIQTSVTPTQVMQNERSPVGVTLEPTDINKTELVRNLVREHPKGITPNDLWKTLNGRIAYRPYLYSILKRLKDRGEVVQTRGGKYCPRNLVKDEESKEQATIQ
jgi:hypothetical protein